MEQERGEVMDKLKDLMSRCKAGVFISVNEHRNYHKTAEQTLQQLDGLEVLDIDQKVRDRMIETDVLIEIQFYPEFYPDTPIGFCTVYHYDIESAIDEALACFTDAAHET